MPTPSAADAASKWAQNLGASTSRIQAGVQAVTVSPGQAAARQKQAYINGVNANAAKWAANVAAVSLTTWQNDVINKGIPRIASGASAAQPKFEAFMTRLLPFINQQVAALPQRGDLNANIARMTAFVTAMSKFKNTPGA